MENLLDVDDRLSRELELASEEEIQRVEDEDRLAEQDKQFKELQKKLINLKEENKRQMDIIINNLDELIADKALIEKTLDEIDDQSDILVPELKYLSIVDVLTTLTETNNENQTSRLDTSDTDQQNNSPVSKSKTDENSKETTDDKTNVNQEDENLKETTDDKTNVNQEENDSEKDALSDSGSFQKLCDQYIDKIKIPPIDLNFETLTTQNPDD